MTKQNYSKFLLIFVVLFSITNILAMHYHLYWRLWWFDIVMHFLGGVWIGSATLWVYYLSNRFKNIPENRRCIPYVYGLVVVIIIVIGIFWELFEFSFDTLIIFHKLNSWTDTISDIVFAVIGAIITTKYFIYKNYHQEASIPYFEK
ncbi:hypothetical protein KJ973_01695 [Patescibacteria group bacterium]|nr:hypothetical protein [Patescibacteria group bacterium]MBU1246607.1 hypothetical protein [Patescibacteria group bacterium]MBU1519388.1 hypothetical protein [Patescibacteria group bacterium]MBU1730224.1 hypothetical protein [Patescibacteria group bacterium]MBU1956346.1 hypothetical protein [Patescibacteria group bacterium]